MGGGRLFSNYSVRNNHGRDIWKCDLLSRRSAGDGRTGLCCCRVASCSDHMASFKAAAGGCLSIKFSVKPLAAVDVKILAVPVSFFCSVLESSLSQR